MRLVIVAASTIKPGQVCLQFRKRLPKPGCEEFPGFGLPRFAPPQPKMLQVRDMDCIQYIRPCLLENLINKSKVLLHRVAVPGVESPLGGLYKGCHFQVKQSLRAIINFGSDFREPRCEQLNEPLAVDIFRLTPATAIFHCVTRLLIRRDLALSP